MLTDGGTGSDVAEGLGPYWEGSGWGLGCWDLPRDNVGIAPQACV